MDLAVELKMKRKKSCGKEGKGIPERGSSLYKCVRKQVINTSSFSFGFPLIHLANHCCNIFQKAHCTALISLMLKKCSWSLLTSK